jgi:hypothetical protein
MISNDLYDCTDFIKKTNLLFCVGYHIGDAVSKTGVIIIISAINKITVIIKNSIFALNKSK